MGKKERGKRDGTGPFKGSLQEVKFGLGKRMKAGEECPIGKKSFKLKRR